MKIALLISHSQKNSESLSDILKSEGYTDVAVSETADTAKNFTQNGEFDLICINAPLENETGIELSKHFAETTRSSVIIIVPQKNADDVNDLLTEHGVLVIAKPVNKHLFHHFLHLLELLH